MTAPRPAQEPLTTVRQTPRYRVLGLLVGAGLGLLLASVHWLGLVVGGALVGLVAPDLRGALLQGLAFGILVLLGWAVLLAMAGSLGAVLATGQLVGLAVAIGIGGAVIGSLVRGIV